MVKDEKIQNPSYINMKLCWSVHFIYVPVKGMYNTNSFSAVMVMMSSAQADKAHYN